MDTDADGDPDWGDGVTTLREAIISADNAGGGTIDFAANMQGKTILLKNALPAISKPDFFNGPGKNNLTIARDPAAGDDFRLLFITGNAPVTISGVTLSGGQLLRGGGVGMSGAGIYMDSGILNLINSALTNNKTSSDGGGIYVSGDSPVTLDNTELTGNRADGDGAGIYVTSGGVEIKNNSLVDSNISQGRGGGLFVASPVNSGNRSWATITDSKVTNSESRFEGGAVYEQVGRDADEVTVTATNSKFNNNRAREAGGGAVYADSSFQATNCYFDNNTGKATYGYVIMNATSPDPTNMVVVVSLTGCSVT